MCRQRRLGLWTVADREKMTVIPYLEGGRKKQLELSVAQRSGKDVQNECEYNIYVVPQKSISTPKYHSYLFLLEYPASPYSP